MLPSNREYLAHLELAAADRTLIRLASNENTERPSPRVREALERAYEDANLSPSTLPPLRLALAARYGVTSGHVLLGAGSTEVIEATMRTFLRAGDEVVLPTPSWPVYRRRLEALEARIVEVPLSVGDRSYAYDVERLTRAVTKKTKLMILCTPNNPTGFDPDVVLSPLVHEYANIVLSRTFSKAYCLAGLRVGYVVGDAGVLDYVDRFLVPGSSISSAALHAGLAALEDEDHHDRQVERIRTERARVLAGLRTLGLGAFDSAGNFVAVAVPDYPGEARAFAAAVREQGIVIRVMDQHLVRITVGRIRENDRLLAAVATVASSR